MENKYLIIDFDSTFVQVEALDELAKIVLKNHPKQNELVKQIEQITNLGMEGKLSFAESLKRRLDLFQPSEEQIDNLIELLNTKISKSILANRNFFQQYKQQIYIISGGFQEYIYPVVKESGLAMSHILANQFLFDQNGNYLSYDKTKPLSQTGGKIIAVKQLRLPGEVIVIGDGYTDYEIKQAGLAKTFYAFTENISREKVKKLADKVMASFDEVISNI